MVTAVLDTNFLYTFIYLGFYVYSLHGIGL